MMIMSTHRQTGNHAARLRQSSRKRRTFSDEYKRNVLNTVAELIEKAPHKIGVFLKTEGLTWSGIQQWKDQVFSPDVPEQTGAVLGNSNREKISTSGGVRGMKVGRAGKYKNATLDRLYSENIQLKEKLAELEGKQKKVNRVIELQEKILDVLEVGPRGT